MFDQCQWISCGAECPFDLVFYEKETLASSGQKHYCRSMNLASVCDSRLEVGGERRTSADDAKISPVLKTDIF